MRNRFMVILLLAFLALGRATGQQFQISSVYETIVNLFLFDPDPNKGLSVFLSSRIPMGGIAESMGTAYTAVCLDASFLESNPAGSAVLPNTELALYHNNWIADTRIEGIVYNSRFGSLGLGIGGKWLYLPFTEYDHMGLRVTTGYYSEMLAIANASWHLIPGYYFYGIVIGANVKLAYRSVPDYGDENGVLIEGSGADQSALAVMLDAGFLTRFDLFKFYSSREQNFSVGLSLSNLGLPSLGEPMPSEITMGLAWSPLRPLLFSFDITQPFNLVDLTQSEDLYFGFGYSMQLTDFWDLQAGLLFKGGPRFTLGSSIAVNPLVLVVNYTLDLTTLPAPLNRLSLELRFDMGDSGRRDIMQQVDNLYILGLEAYASGDIEQAIAFWQEALDLNPYFDPAREGIDMANATLDLQRRVQDRNLDN
ncbi:MAG TPA: hypothetical protein DCX65_09410 [Spirochaetaceae bacterium]|nr:hypothetical protein [Spirochaetaceae bacterium]